MGLGRAGERAAVVGGQSARQPPARVVVGGRRGRRVGELVGSSGRSVRGRGSCRSGRQWEEEGGGRRWEKEGCWWAY